MANVELKTDFKDGEVLFGEQLNNNFKAIKAALEAANKIAWQDNLDDEVIAFKGTTEEVENRPIINGQLVYDIEKAITYIDIITYTEEDGYPTLAPQRINLSGGVKTISEGDLADIIEPGIYLVKPGSSVTDNKGSGADIKEARHYDSVLIVGKHGTIGKVWQTLERGFFKFYRDLYMYNTTNEVYLVDPWQKYEPNVPTLYNLDLADINKPGVYMVDHDTTTDNMRVGDTYAVSYIDYYIVVRKYTDETMFQYSWDNTMSYAYFRMLNLDSDGNTISVTEWSKTDYMIPNIKSGDYADILAEGTYIVGGNLTDRLSSIVTIGSTYNKLMYVVRSGGSSSPNIKQTLIDGFDTYVRTVYTDASYTTANSATAWEKKTIGEGGGANIYIGEEEPTDDSNVWIDPNDMGTIDGLLNTLFPIGKVEIFYDDLDHSNHLGFTWERTALERSPIGYNPDATSDNYKTIGNKFGTAQESVPLVSHSHNLTGMPNLNTTYIGTGTSGNASVAVIQGTGSRTTTVVGDDSNVISVIHPVEVMAFWKRIG